MFLKETIKGIKLLTNSFLYRGLQLKGKVQKETVGFLYRDLQLKGKVQKETVGFLYLWYLPTRANASTMKMVNTPKNV